MMDLLGLFAIGCIVVGGVTSYKMMKLNRKIDGIINDIDKAINKLNEYIKESNR